MFVIKLKLSHLNRPLLSVVADALTSLVLDASCSFDPDLSPQQYGPATQGLSYTFECYRHCESAPVHNVLDPLYSFVNWTDPSTHYSTSCVESVSSTTGCFVPFNFHISGPITSYKLDDWFNTPYPLIVNPSLININYVNLFLLFLVVNVFNLVLKDIPLKSSLTIENPQNYHSSLYCCYVCNQMREQWNVN